MSQSNVSLSEKDQLKRDMILSGNIWKVVIYIGAPLAFYATVGHFFKAFDSIMASYISAEAVSAVSFLSQLITLISAIGAGIAVGASIKISEAYGSGDFELVQKRVSTILFLCLLFSALVIVIIFPFSRHLLVATGTPEAFIDVGLGYFRVNIFDIAMSFFNGIYFSIERVRGNSKKILVLNLVAMVFKLIFNYIFVYKMNGTVITIAVSTLLSNGIIFAVGLFDVFAKKDIFAFNIKSVDLKSIIVKPMLVTSVPVMCEKMGFSAGKAIVNSMSSGFDNLAVGALGISNNIGGFSSAPQGGFQDGGAAIISQNLGAGNVKRSYEAFKVIVVVNCLIGLFFGVFCGVFIRQISDIFSSGNAEFSQMISSIYIYEAFACVPLGMYSAIVSLFYGFGYTKVTLLLNVLRVFVFRIPVLYILKNFTSIGYQSLGMTMFISNFMSALVAVVAFYFVIKKIEIDTGVMFVEKQKGG